METMDLQDTKFAANEGVAFRAVSSFLLLTATALLVGSLITAQPANISPNSGQLTTDAAI